MAAIQPHYIRQPGGIGGGMSPLTPEQIAALLSLLAGANREPVTTILAELVVDNTGRIVYGVNT